MQPPNDGVTVIVDVMGAPVVFVEVKEGTSPDPLAPRPMAVLLFVHAKAAPAGVLLKLVVATISPAHTATSDGAETVGTGLTVTVIQPAGLTHPLTVAVTQ